ncbi:hypothetical protein [Ralstonia sp. A12]|uniref:hypothetical protein n=1 Tax=Ralstonia sp. A12 TaxID=1217052 RepID=UPI001E29E95D|nr:hypothetical protein [Ralstonia sp. A12]
MTKTVNNHATTSTLEAIYNIPDTQETTRIEASPKKPNLPRSRSPRFDGLPTAPRHRLSGNHHPELRRPKSETAGAPGTKQRLVVVSNRLIDPKQPAAGGLAVALGEMMHGTEGLWFGWSGKTTDQPESTGVRTESFGRTTLAQVDLSQKHHDGYYAGF